MSESSYLVKGSTLFILGAMFSAIPYAASWVTNQSAIPQQTQVALQPVPQKRVLQSPQNSQSANRIGKFASNYEQVPADEHDAVSPVAYIEPVASVEVVSLAEGKKILEKLGARYMVIEQRGNQFECRCLFPVENHSAIEKVFYSEGTSAEIALREVIESVKIWKKERVFSPSHVTP